ncbi:MAG TPA: M13 family metallopeptidase, partial [Saprospiraceae bacterium]|nr:M13 family metallopeptidase [Saprospiraceae bacterium]
AGAHVASRLNFVSIQQQNMEAKTKTPLCWPFLLAGLFIMTSCKEKPAAPETKDYSHYLDELIDNTVRPGEDFNRYSTGTWLKRNPIPADQSSWGVFQVIPDEIFGRLKSLNEDGIQKQPAAGTQARKIADFWLSGMDTVQIEREGLDSLKRDLERIDNIQNRNDLAELTGYLHHAGAGPGFSAVIYQDEKISSQYMLHLQQGGLGLPDRDYYFDTDARTQKIREAYRVHLENMFRLSGIDSMTAKENSRQVMQLETKLASSSRKLADLRDPYLNYHKMDLAGFQKLVPAFDWKRYESASRFGDIDSLIVGQPEFFSQLNRMLKSEPIANWKAYLRWHVLHAYAPFMNTAFEQEHFRFYGTVMSGKTAMKPRWKRVLEMQERYLGEALGQLYVERYYSPALKARHERLVDDVVAAYRDRIQKLDWMSDSTKAKALYKLNAITKKVGYPEKWKDFSDFQVSGNSYVANAKNGNRWWSDYSIAKLKKPVDKYEWEMTPQTYNAYYNPSNNEIVLPAAAFIVPGIPEDQVDDAILYAYAGGSTIGHELTHAFDDQGSQFDAEGNLKNWWSVSDKEQFQNRCKGIVVQFNRYVVLDSLRINGEATQGENIADLGGILVGLDAFKKTKQYLDGASIGGFTPLQRYFFGWSLSWLGHVRDEALAMKVKTDVHAPTFLRINGPIVNVDEWYEAFGVKEGDPMYVKPEERVRIW